MSETESVDDEVELTPNVISGGKSVADHRYPAVKKLTQLHHRGFFARRIHLIYNNLIVKTYHGYKLI